MGACQSNLCQCGSDVEPALIKGHVDKQGNVSFNNQQRGTKRNTDSKIKVDILSPGAMTEATEPTPTTYTPHSHDAFSLVSAISSARLSSDAGRTKKFDFAILEEEEQEFSDASDDENFQELTQNPPLLAPPPGQAEIVLEQRKTERMMNSFSKLQHQLSVSNKNNDRAKKEAKIEDRRIDVKGYRSLWSDFLEMKRIEQLSGSKDGDTHGDEDRKNDESLNIQDSSAWFVDFKNEMRAPSNLDDDEISKSEFSLLSEHSLEVQRNLFRKKRSLREARNYERKQKLQAEVSDSCESEAFSASNNSQSTRKGKDYESYFRGILTTNNTEKRTDDNPNTPRLSPPKLQVVTNETKTVRDDMNDYGPIFKHQKARAPEISESFQGLEVHCEQGRDDASLISFDNDSLILTNTSFGGHGHFRARANAEKPSERFTQVDQLNRQAQHRGRRERPFRKKNVSSGVAAMSNAAASKHKSESLDTRIVNLEKKMGIFSSKDPGTERAHSTNIESQTPIESYSKPGFLSPMKLEDMFDKSPEEIASSASNKARETREKIVMRNASKCHKSTRMPSIHLMNKEQFEALAEHALVRVSRLDDSYLVQEPPTDEKNYNNDELATPNTSFRNTSLANEITEEVQNLLGRYREVVDAHEILKYDGNDSVEEDTGKLYSF